MRDFADELIHLAGNLDSGTTTPSQAYDDLHAIAKDLQSEKNWADEYFTELFALRAENAKMREALTSVLNNPTILAESASAWSIRNKGKYSITKTMNERADYYESIRAALSWKDEA